MNYTNKGFVLEFKNDKMVNVEKLIKIVKKNFSTFEVYA